MHASKIADKLNYKLTLSQSISMKNIEKKSERILLIQDLLRLFSNERKRDRFTCHSFALSLSLSVFFE
jgi:hypothetical protein